jgi:hypothetical protein
MKKVFTDSSVIPCDMAKGVLESNGIQSMIRNERGSALGGVGYPNPFMMSLAYAWPEVWVRDEDFTAATHLIAQMKASQPSDAEPWKCSQCGESVDGEFSVCWNCEMPRGKAESTMQDERVAGDDHVQ